MWWRKVRKFVKIFVFFGIFQVLLVFILIVLITPSSEYIESDGSQGNGYKDKQIPSLTILDSGKNSLPSFKGDRESKILENEDYLVIDLEDVPYTEVYREVESENEPEISENTFGIPFEEFWTEEYRDVVNCHSSCGSKKSRKSSCILRCIFIGLKYLEIQDEEVRAASNSGGASVHTGKHFAHCYWAGFNLTVLAYDSIRSFLWVHRHVDVLLTLYVYLPDDENEFQQVSIYLQTLLNTFTPDRFRLEVWKSPSITNNEVITIECVSDYARFHALFYHGGFYFDLDTLFLRDSSPLWSLAWSGSKPCAPKLQPDALLATGHINVPPRKGNPYVTQLFEHVGRDWKKCLDLHPYDLPTLAANSNDIAGEKFEHMFKLSYLYFLPHWAYFHDDCGMALTQIPPDFGIRLEGPVVKGETILYPNPHDFFKNKGFAQEFVEEHGKSKFYDSLFKGAYGFHWHNQWQERVELFSGFYFIHKFLDEKMPGTNVEPKQYEDNQHFV